MEQIFRISSTTMLIFAFKHLAPKLRNGLPLMNLNHSHGLPTVLVFMLLVGAVTILTLVAKMQVVEEILPLRSTSLPTM